MTPTGTILPFYGSARLTPKGYLICNGDEFTKKQYPKLYQVLVASNPDLKIDGKRCRLPDFRGMFLRGLDRSRGIDPDRKLGSEQNDSIEEHDHVYSRLRSFSTSNYSDGGGRGDQTMPKKGSRSRESGEGGDGANPYSITLNNNFDRTEPKGLPDETRPKNVAINFIIST